jgi:hypothetical protein
VLWAVGSGQQQPTDRVGNEVGSEQLLAGEVNIETVRGSAGLAIYLVKKIHKLINRSSNYDFLLRIWIL